MAYSADSDLIEYQPDILSFGIDIFVDEHEKAKSDIIRELKFKWYSKKNTSVEFDPDLLIDSQFKVASVYLVLWKYALPQLTNWISGDRFQSMIEFYKSRYNDEMADILAAGVEYDADNDGSITSIEKQSIGAGRLTR